MRSFWPTCRRFRQQRWIRWRDTFAEAGVAPGAFALVHGVNTLHVANDLAFTLGEVRTALAPGGSLVISECVRPFPRQPVYVEFVFNLIEAFREPVLDAVRMLLCPDTIDSYHWYVPALTRST